MTDKQIIIYKKECYNEPHCSLNQVLEQLNAYKMEADEGKEINAELKAELKRKEQECEELKENLPNAITRLMGELDQLKAIIKKYEECNKYLVEENGKTYTRLEYKLLKTLIEIKELIQSDYCTEIESCEFCAEVGNCLNRKILQKISEVE